MAATNLTEIVKETKIVYIRSLNVVQLPVPIKRNSIGKAKTTFENVRKSGNYFVNSFENHYYVKLLNRALVKVVLTTHLNALQTRAQNIRDATTNF